MKALTATSIPPTELNYLTEFRRKLHRYPEVSGHEFQTAHTIALELKALQPDLLLEGLGGTGVAAVFDSGHPGPALLFRAELDALPIEEVNRFAHRSLNDLVSHKCGHDGHMTVLLGLGRQLAEHPPSKGKVILLFQPSEENGAGAQAVLHDPQFPKLQPDRVFAFHNLPAYPMGQIILRKGTFTASVRSLIIKLFGKTSHAAEPEHGINPALAIADLIQATHTLSNNEQNRPDFAVVTPVHLNMGEVAYGISAGYGEIHLTIRTWTEAVMQQLIQEIVGEIEKITKEYRLRYELEWTDVFQANKNADTAVDQLEAVAVANQFDYIHKSHPTKWGEDFGYFSQVFPGALFGIGAGLETPALHNPDYDFPDELIETGVRMFLGIIRSA